MSKQKTVKLKTLLIVDGQFLVLTTKEVQVHLLSRTGTMKFWDSMAIAETRVFKPEQAREYVIRQTFGADAVNFIPAGNQEAVLYYALNYVGPLAEAVKGICAAIMTGTPYGFDETFRNHVDDTGGERITQNPVPKDSGPSGAMFDDDLALFNNMKDLEAEAEVMAWEGSQV